MPDGGIVTILFTDVVGSTETLGRVGEVAANALRQDHFTTLRASIAEHRGEEIKNLGDGLMVVFASAIDAVACAVAMQEATARTAAKIRVGLDVGEPFREGGDYFGTPVVVASRLCAAATVGQILASDLVRALASTRASATFHDAGYLALKGIAEPVAAWEVAWEVPASPSQLPLPAALGTGNRVPFVGRQRELDQLLVDWKAARDGRRTVSLLAGEPGIGKTRLAAELAAHAHEHGGVVLFGRCDEEPLTPYQPFVEALDHVIRHVSADELEALLGDTAPELVRLIPNLHERLPGITEAMRSEAETERYRVFEAVRSFLTALVRSTPLLLVLDDLHWADKPTLLLLQHLLRPGEELALHIVGTYRDTDLDRRHPLAATLADLRRQVGFERIALGGLVESDIDDFLDLITGQDAPPGFARLLKDQTEGNPFFIGEVLRHLVESGAVSVVDGQWTAGGGVDALPIPEGVKEVIGRRLTRLSDEANQILGVAAVLGRDFDLDVLLRVADVDEESALTALDAAVGARLVVERVETMGQYHFVHALVRETLYEELSSARRSRLHRRAAVTLDELHGSDAQPPLAQLAYHYAEAAQAGDVDKAVAYARRAGQAALDVVAYEEAAGHFERALQVLDLAEGTDGKLRGELLISLGDARYRAGDRGAAQASFDGALTLARTASDADQFARAALGWTGEWEPGTVRPEVVAHLEEALERLPASDSVIRAEVLGKLSQERYFDDDPTRARELATEAEAMARRVDDPTALAIALGAGMANYVPMQDTERWVAKLAEAVELAARGNDASAVNRARTALMWNLLELGDVARFDAELEVTEAFATALRAPVYAWAVPMWRATRAIMAGQLTRGEELSVEAVTIGQQCDSAASLQMFGVQFYSIRREQGRLAETESGVRSMVEQYPAVPAWRTALALVLAETGRPDEARAELRPVAEVGVANIRRDGNWPIGISLLADVWDALGEPDPEASVAYELFLPFAHRFVNVGNAADSYGSVHRTLGVFATLVERYDAAERHFLAGIDADARTDGQRCVVRGQWQYAKMLVRRGAAGDRERADGIAEDGLATAERLGLTAAAERLRAIASPS
ncbi:MAG: ATP-binding protein [Acidimicrobiales bacterium]